MDEIHHEEGRGHELHAHRGGQRQHGRQRPAPLARIHPGEYQQGHERRRCARRPRSAWAPVGAIPASSRPAQSCQRERSARIARTSQRQPIHAAVTSILRSTPLGHVAPPPSMTTSTRDHGPERPVGHAVRPRMALERRIDGDGRVHRHVVGVHPDAQHAPPGNRNEEIVRQDRQVQWPTPRRRPHRSRGGAVARSRAARRGVGGGGPASRRRLPSRGRWARGSRRGSTRGRVECPREARLRAAGSLRRRPGRTATRPSRTLSGFSRLSQVEARARDAPRTRRFTAPQIATTRPRPPEEPPCASFSALVAKSPRNVPPRATAGGVIDHAYRAWP